MNRILITVAFFLSACIAAVDAANAQGEHLKLPVYSIQACLEIGHKQPNDPAPMTCIGEGGSKAGFFGRNPEILVRFRELRPGTHTLKVRYYNYEAATNQFRWTKGKHDQQFPFKNDQEAWACWFPAKAKVGVDCRTAWKAEIYVDNSWRGDVTYSGSAD